MNVGDLVKHNHSGRMYLVAKRHGQWLVALVGWSPEQMFNVRHDLTLVQAARSLTLEDQKKIHLSSLFFE